MKAIGVEGEIWKPWRKEGRKKLRTCGWLGISKKGNKITIMINLGKKKRYFFTEIRDVKEVIEGNRPYAIIRSG